MSIRVIWRPRTFDRMNEIVQAYPGRKAEFAAALRELHLALTSNPDTAGESREPPYRVIVCGQLTFRFRPALDQDRVYVVRVSLRRPRP